MIRRKLVAANWKMHLDRNAGEDLVESILDELEDELRCDVVIAPPFPHIPVLADLMDGSGINLGAQHCHFENKGAFTGEVSVSILKSFGVEFIITGHSERRQHFGETDEIVRMKVDAILNEGLIPIFCCGESLETRNQGLQETFVRNQLEASLFHLDANAMESCIIAYEPIWAIGTGVTATPEQAQEMHAFIRECLKQRFGTSISEGTRILYGGSIKADNAASLFSQPDVDGGLVGGASLEAAGFNKIIEAACG